MSAFEYHALDSNGRKKRGVLQGDTARQVRQSLRDQGLSPLRVDLVGTDQSATGQKRSGSGLKAAERALILRQLASLLGSGLPLEESLGIVAEQADKPGVKRIIAALRARIMEGHSLAEAMQGFPRAFPELERATVEAGEQSGRLDHILARLADYSEQREQVGREAGLALLYPVILAIVAFAVVAGLVTYVVPKITGVFLDMDVQLPWLTTALLATSDFAQRWFAGLLLGVLGLVTAAVFAMRVPEVRQTFHSFLLRLPLFGRLIRSTQAARFARTLQIMTASGVPLLEGLTIGSKVLTLTPMSQAVEQAALRVREGESLEVALRRSGQFPPILLRLIASGERSGQLEQMLASAADTQEREVAASTALLLGVLQPLLILVVGVVILLIVLAILLPIFQLNQLIQ